MYLERSLIFASRIDCSGKRATAIHQRFWGGGAAHFLPFLFLATFAFLMFQGLQNGAHDDVERWAYEIAGWIPVLGGVAVSLYFLTFRRIIEIDAETVRCRTRRMFRWSEWNEPRSNYKGVLHWDVPSEIRHEHYSNELVLLHECKGKSLLLDASFRSGRLRLRRKQLARALQMPVVQVDGPGFLSLGCQDIDKPLAVLLQEGKIVFAPPDASPPDGILLQYADSGDRTIQLPRAEVPKPVLMSLCGVCLFLFVSIPLGNTPWTYGVIGFLLAVAFGLILALNRRFSRKIVLTRDQVQLQFINHRGWGLSAIEFPRAALLTIRVRRHPIPQLSCLVLETDETEHYTASGLSAAALDWLRNYLLSEMAQEAPVQTPSPVASSGVR